MSRDAFEEMLGAMAWTRLVRLSDATFEKNGTQISSRKVSLMRAALSVDEKSPIEFVMKDKAAASPTRQRKRRTAAPREAEASTEAGNSGADNQCPNRDGPKGRISASKRRWALGACVRPNAAVWLPFVFFSDQVLRGIASNRPTTARELLAVPSLGIMLSKKYGAQTSHLA
jgi:hypothetical protein